MKDIISVRILGPSSNKDFGGFACYAYVIRDRQGNLLHESCGLTEKPNSQSPTSSSIAVYSALLRSLEWLIGHGYQDDIIIVKSSSKSLISQLDEAYQSPHQIVSSNMPKSIIPLYSKAMRLESKFYKLSFELVINSTSKGNNNNYDDDEAASIEESKEIEELLVLAYVEAEEKILKQNNMFAEQKSPFVTAAQLMKYRKAQAS
jgi:hypothetical protein